MTDTDIWFTPAEAARYIKVRTRTLAIWRGRGRGPRFYRLSDTDAGHIRYRREDVEAWMKSNAQEVEA